ncbi:MAG: energy-coupling factor transporter transmembrane protein EcfT [Treponema sp.]|jgi:biotin transport system permease protein|nr:energy-coupling factor transporter transmembrane protein EcfT [Treponema sp.]
MKNNSEESTAKKPHKERAIDSFMLRASSSTFSSRSTILPRSSLFKNPRRSTQGPVPYAYRPGNSFLHRLGGGWKLLALFLISTLAFALGLPVLAAGTVLVIVGSLAAGMRPWELLRGVKPLLLMALLVTLCRSLGTDSERPVFFDRRGCAEGLLFGWGIVLAFCAASLFFSITTMTEIKDALDKLRFKRLSLGLALMLGFLPRFFAVWEAAELAYRARCGKRGLPQLLALVPLTMERMIISAGETAAALEARGCLL